MTAEAAAPARRRYPGERLAVVEHPAPEVTCRAAEPDELPRGASTVRDFAERHNWTVTATYSRGTKPGRLPRLVDSIALRFRRGEARAWAVWLDGRFDAGQVRHPGSVALPVNLTALRGQLSLVEGGAA